MKAWVQRVTEASVTIDGEKVAEIGKGYLVLLGVTHGDTEAAADKIADKLVKLRIFDFYGREAEMETVTLREIEILEIDTQEEKMYGILEEMERQRMQLLPNENMPDMPTETEETDD